MGDYFSFRFYEPGDDKRKSLVIFSTAKVTLDVVVKTLKNDVIRNLVPKNVYIMTAKNSLIKTSECKSDVSFNNEFDSYVGDIEEHLRCVNYSTSGLIYYCNGTPVGNRLSRELLHSGMIAIFKAHKGLITSAHGYHFTKPSGDHCDKFIRASNLLVSSIEVSFLAISLLPKLRDNIKRIYVDTSSIAYLASLAVQMFGDFDNGLPTIESFESYTALNDPYDFVEDSDSLVLISATTSGSLSKNLLEKTSLSNNQIVTLFHINLPTGQEGIFNIESAIDGGIVSRKSTECEFCKRGAKIIRIAGDQFLPETPKHELRVIRKSDFDKHRQLFFEQFAANGVLKWNTVSHPADDFKEHLFISVGQALEKRPMRFIESLDKNIKRYITRDISCVVYFEDEGSIAIKNVVSEYVGDDGKKLNWLAASNLDENEISDSSSVLVMVGAITSGRSLLSISRKLRSIHSSATITYFAAFSKVPSKDAFEQLKKDLEQGGHSLVVLNDCPVPRVKEYTKTAWDWEVEALQPFNDEDPLGGAAQQLCASLLNRYTGLVSQENDSNSLFLLSPNDEILKLRRTFAFWSDFGFKPERLEKTTQADVYWTIQCVLHDLRNKSENNGLATTYHTTLISPANFDRYNDGLVQACLLRASLPVELDYRVDSVFSRQMTDVIISVLINWSNDQGEASLEFLMALWTKRLQINDDHLREIIKLVNDDMPESMRFILNLLSSNRS